MAKSNIDLFYDIGELLQLFEKTMSIDNFLHNVVDLIAAHMKADVCTIYLYNEEEGKLVLTTTIGLPKDYIGKVKLSPGEGITGLCFREGRSILEADGEQNIAFKLIPGLSEERYTAFLAVPIIRSCSTLGVLVLQHKKKGYFTVTDERTLNVIAAQIAVVIENAKLILEITHKTRKPKQVKEFNNILFIKGSEGSNGIAFGRAVIIGKRNDAFLGFPGIKKKVPTLKDFERALGETLIQLEQLQRDMEKEFSEMVSLIFSAHLLMLGDSAFSGKMLDLIRKGKPVQDAIIQVINHYIDLFSKNSNPRFNEKVLDVKDIGHRLLRNLYKKQDEPGDYTDQIIVAQELLPSELVKLSAQKVEGFLLFGGGITAHIAILARSIGIPMVFSDDERIFRIHNGTELILDGFQGTIIMNPSKEVYDHYQILNEEQKKIESKKISGKILTKDGVRVFLYANINLLSDLKIAIKMNAEGIGLYRSEFPYLVRNELPSEEDQYRVYRKLLEEMEGKDVCLRTLDIGGDKMLSYLSPSNEANPFLGLRAIRFSLKNKGIFSTQLRAMLRAGEGFPLKIMFPLIASVDDFLEVKQIVQENIDLLQKAGVACNNKPHLGAMIELPSIVEVARELALHADFFSIGTNDLIQYMLGIDRTNEAVSTMYTHYHPAVFRALNKVVAAAKSESIDLSVCGDIASDSLIIYFLIGIGVRKLSLNPRLLGDIQQHITLLSVEEAEKVARKILSMGTTKDIHQYVQSVFPKALLP
ncbi:MAG: phosphoenolpyruvate--protein phosphotransferase [Spirochaetales bacterium]|nr:phosphoenolpyruvate--protein phosphotransferase [Spirochaetales bacterium]